MKILVVDDEITSRITLEAFTKTLEYNVLSASDGDEAFNIWKRERPRIVVTDWNMPNMSGLDLCKQIRNNEGDEYTYIIIVTSRNTSHDVVQGMEAGADDYITKPFNKDELYVRLKAGERVINLQDKDMVIFVMAKLAESRDSDTGDHLERVRHYCKTVAESIYKGTSPLPELDRKFIDNIFLTSPLHDIGKVGIPDIVLLKPGRLEEKEFEIMKTHTTIGFNTLNEALQKNPKADYLKMSADIALNHHEKYDGTGYPNALKEEAIPLSARITALADVYDALTTKRPYKDAFSHEKSIAIIRDGEGSHFDPLVVKALFECEDQFKDIRLKFSYSSFIDKVKVNLTELRR